MRCAVGFPVWAACLALTTLSRSLPPAAGLRAHVELLRVSGKILCNTYRIAPWEQNVASATRHLDKSMQLLDGWLKGLPPSLQLTPGGYSPDPACCTLHMAYNQVSCLCIPTPSSLPSLTLCSFYCSPCGPSSSSS
jgi:hypothetical protein